MPKFNVTGKYIANYEVEIEATSEDEAIELAEGLGLEHWSAVEYDFEIDIAELLA